MRVSASWRPAILLTLTAVAVAFSRHLLGDYTLGLGENHAAPGVDRLAAGDLAGLAEAIPAMGLVSLLVRVPAAVVGGSDLLLVHRLGSLLCLMAVVVLAVALDRRAAADERPLSYRVVAGALLVAGPGIFWAIDNGHPEEYLGGALCVGAVLAAIDGRRVLAPVLLGLAIGNKQWALLAVVPVLVPLGPPHWFAPERLKAGAIAAGVALLFVVPPVLANPDRYHSVSDSLTRSKRVYVQSVWFPVAPSSTRSLPFANERQAPIVVTTYALPLGMTRGKATILVVLFSLALVPIAFRRGGMADPLAVLTALLTLRCVMDPMNLDYYLAPALTAAVAWDVVRGPRSSLPLVALGATAVAYAVWERGTLHPYGVSWALWLAAMVPLLLIGLFGRGDSAAPVKPLSRAA